MKISGYIGDILPIYCVLEGVEMISLGNISRRQIFGKNRQNIINMSTIYWQMVINRQFCQLISYTTRNRIFGDGRQPSPNRIYP